MATVSGKPEPLSDEILLADLKLQDNSPHKNDEVRLPGLISADGGVGLTGTLPEKDEAASGEITSEESLEGNKLLDIVQKVIAAHAAPAVPTPVLPLPPAPVVPAPALPLQPAPAVPAPVPPLQPAPAPPLQPAPVVNQLNNNPWVKVVRRHRPGQQVRFDDDEEQQQQLHFDDDDEDELFIGLEIEEGTPSSEEEDEPERVLWVPNTTSRRAAMNWSQARQSSYVCTKNGPGFFVYGSYGPGFQY